MTFLSKVFKHRDESTRKHKYESPSTDTPQPSLAKPRFLSTWDSVQIVPDEIEELVHSCTLEIKARAEALDTPFLLLPFRPDYDSNASKVFIQNFFASNKAGRSDYNGASLLQELRLSEPEVLCSIVKWCWARMPGGVVGWNVYELFRLGERESGMLRTSFDTFIPMTASSTSTKHIIYDFFDLLAAIAAHGKVNGLTGSKLSRLAGWWAFAPTEETVGFESAYRHWTTAADASAHLFFAFLRSRAPEDVDGTSGISTLPRYLQTLVAQTEYPPTLPRMMQSTTSKVVMIVDSVSPDPFALLRRANHFEFRPQDKALQQFSDYIDPTQALTEECRRVLQAIAAANQSSSNSYSSAQSPSPMLSSGLSTANDDGWSRFQDQGFSSLSANAPIKATERPVIPLARSSSGLRHFGPSTTQGERPRPTTPSWADFLSEKQRPPPSFLPASKSLPALHAVSERQDSAYSQQADLEPGELASTTQFTLDESFWWVWMTSLASEEPAKRKAAFGRCALIETYIPDGRWLVVEEQIKGATNGPEEGAYIAEKKSRFAFARRKTSTRRAHNNNTVRSMAEGLHSINGNPKKSLPGSPSGNVSFDQQLMIKAAAVELARKTRDEKHDNNAYTPTGRRGRFDDASSVKTSSMLTLGGLMDMQPALKWSNIQDKEAIRKQYLGANFSMPDAVFEDEPFSHADTPARSVERDLPRPPQFEHGSPAMRASPPTTSSGPSPEATAFGSTTPPHYSPSTRRTEINPASPVDSAGLANSPDAQPRKFTIDPTQSPDRRSIHPALRDDTSNMDGSGPPGDAALIGATAAWHSDLISQPESPSRQKTAKLTKNRAGNTGGLRKMFSRKKTSSRPRSTADSDASQGTSGSSSHGAQFSMLHGESLINGQRQSQKAVTEVDATTLDRSMPRVANGSDDETPEYVVPVSPISTDTDKEAHEHFSRFDQGVEEIDEHSYVVDDTEDVQHDFSMQNISTTQPEVEDLTTERPARFNREESVYAIPMELSRGEAGYQAFEGIAEEVEDFPVKATSPSQSERWAAIRQAAATRASPESSPKPEQKTYVPVTGSISDVITRYEQIRPATTNKDQMVSTGGEESIEERVARIKARVAHLTAAQPNRPTPAVSATNA